MSNVLFRKTALVPPPLTAICYLVVYDFKGAQSRDKKKHRLINPRKNSYRNQFYEWLEKHYPDLMPNNALDSTIEVGNLGDAEIIYNKVIEHQGTAYLYEAKRLRA